MQPLQTFVDIPVSTINISYATPVMMLGSCFVENMGKRMEDYRLPVVVNPNGIVYNPKSVATTLEDILDERMPDESEYLFNEGRWHSLRHHSAFSHEDKATLMESIATRQRDHKSFLRSCKYIIITWGTAWVYRYKESGHVVANCHKLPAREFDRFRLSVDTIIDNYKTLLLRLREFNPELKVLFTVSPIRHVKDGLHENQLSKSTLLLAIDQLQQEFDFVDYFPAYEIVMDELRDYRFYAEDMAHVSAVTVQYIWDKFMDNYIDTKCFSLFKSIEKINKFRAHRPFNIESDAYKEAVQKNEKLSEQIDKTISKYGK
ncbi:MAG: GSCFA domain-containing protein [Marinifilaceae bacterium]